MTVLYKRDTFSRILRNKRVQQERHIVSIPESTETAYASTKAEALAKLRHHQFALAPGQYHKSGKHRGSWLKQSQFIYWDVAENGHAVKTFEVVE